MTRLSIKVLITTVFICTAAPILFGQEPANPPDRTIDAATRTQVIDAILNRLNEAYVFPETAKKMEASIRERVSRKEYDQITSARSFAELLTSHLQAVSKDKHLRVRYSHEPIPVRPPRREPTAEEHEVARR
jgi:hypothetical protein